jgi:hypothetical protein
MPFVALGTGAIIVAALLQRWKSRTVATVPVSRPAIDASDGELAALDAAVRRDA